MNFENSKTKQNIENSFICESQARNRYSFYAQKAREEGQEDIANIFEQLADNEKEHAKVWYKLLNSGIDDTPTNLQQAAKTENQEWKQLYPQYAREAKKEGFEDIAVLFEKIASIEYSHERRFNEAILNLLNSKEKEMKISFNDEILEQSYQCIFCGYSQTAKFDICPVCDSQM